MILSDLKDNVFTPEWKYKPVEKWAMPDEIIERFYDITLEKLKGLEGMTFDTEDYDVNVGSYEFRFSVRRVEEHEDYGLTLMYILHDGTVDIEDTENGGFKVFDVIEALNHEDFGWEVQHEINDIVRSIVYVMVPEIRVILHNTDFTVELW